MTKEHASTYEISETPQGRVLTPKSAWREEFSEIMLEHGLVGIELNTAKGWPSEGLAFLEQINDIRYFEIIDHKRKDTSEVHFLSNLEYLSLNTFCKTIVDFRVFARLEECFLEWRPKAESISDCVSLKSLYINMYDKSTLDDFSKLRNLQVLKIGNAPLRTIESVKHLPEMKHLAIYNSRRLTEASCIESLSELRVLELDGCRIITLPSLPKKLLCISLCDNGPVNSLLPLAEFPELRAAVFYGTTNVLDGQLDFLKSLDKLETVAFQNRKHYSIKCEELRAYNQPLLRPFSDYYV